MKKKTSDATLLLAPDGLRRRAASNAVRPLPERQHEIQRNRLVLDQTTGLKKVRTQMGVAEIHLKTIFIGESGCGKTQLVRRLVRSQFNPSAPSTVEYDKHEVLVQLDKHVVTLDIWDTAGQERYRALTPQFFRDSLICVVVYDICDRHSFEEASWWLKHYVTETVPRPPGATLMGLNQPNVALVGTKCDMEHLRQVECDEAEELAVSYNIWFAEMTALYGQGAGEFERILHDLSGNAFASLQGRRRNSDPTSVNVVNHTESLRFGSSSDTSASGLKVRAGPSVATAAVVSHHQDSEGCCA